MSSEQAEQLVRLELATVGGGESDAGSAEVVVACANSAVVMTATEPRSGRSLTRTIELDRGGEGADRVLAISVAQLVRALDWLPATSVKPAPVVVERPAAASAPAKLGAELQLGGGARLRQASKPWLSQQLALRSGFAVTPAVKLGGGIGYEWGTATRQGGRVDARLLGGGFGSSFEPWRGRRWSCLLRIDVSLQHLTLSGVDAMAGVRASRVRGFGGEARVAAGPALRLSSFGLALLAEGGGAYFGGEAQVSGDSPVNLNGAWSGVELALLWRPD